MSKLNSIRVMLQKALEQFSKITTDKGILSFEEDEIAVGVAVKIVDEEGNESEAADGEYKIDDGTVYVIAEGKVAEIREPEPEEPKAEEPAPVEAKQEFSRISAEKFESYEERERQIVEAIRANGVEDCWLVEAGDNYAIICEWNGESEKYMRYDVALDGENVSVSNPIEVVSKFVPVEDKTEDVQMEDEKDTRIAELEAEIAEKDKRISELENKIKELEEKPAAAPAEEEFEKQTRVESTGDRRMDNLKRILNAK